MNLTKKAILKKLEDEEIACDPDKCEEAPYISQFMGYIGLNFSIELRGSEDGMDFWYQAEYYSEKLGKTIIWNYDANAQWSNNEECADKLLYIHNEIDVFEAKLPKLT